MKLVFIVLSDFGKACSSYGLTYSPCLFVGNMKLNFFKKFGEFCLKHFVCLFKKNCTAVSACNSAHDKNMFYIIEHGVVGNCVAEIYTHGFIDGRRTAVGKCRTRYTWASV